MKLFVFGLGYSSLAAIAALRELDPGVEIAGTTRDPAKAEVLKGQGIAAYLFDGETYDPQVAAALRSATHLLLSIAPQDSTDPALAVFRTDLDAALDLRWIGYFSTIGVYGDAGGGWVDEAAPRAPDNARSRQRVVVEDAWQDYARQRGVPLAILRLAGIYGPGRSALDKLRDGTARRVVKPGQVFNRIHVADIGRITALVARRRLAGAFNIADDEPAPPQDLITFAAGLLGIAAPPEQPFDAAPLSPMARSFYADNKRVSNHAIKSALDIALLYPDYRAGLTAILAAESR